MRLLMLLFLINFNAKTNAQNGLYPITENGLKGFINAEGKVIINNKRTPQYKTPKSPIFFEIIYL